MNKNEIKNNCYKYFIYSLLAWDLKDRKVENDPRNDVYFFSEQYKKDFCKDLENMRKKNIIKIDYLGNDATSTNFNVYEKNDGEVVIAFRGSDSKLDWAADFAFFKINFRKENQEQLISMGSEDFNKLCMDEYWKSIEDVVDMPIKFFRQSKLTKLTDVDLTKKLSIDNISGNIGEIFERFKSKIEFHGGFISQYKSIAKELNSVFDKYTKDKRFNKITFVGHSLGSSLAQLTYIFQSLRNPDSSSKFSCYVAGTPKIGNKSLTLFLKASGLFNKLYIMNIENDLISMVPPNNFGFIENENTITITPIKAPFNTKMNHTLFYYLYCIKNFANVKINEK